MVEPLGQQVATLQMVLVPFRMVVLDADKHVEVETVVDLVQFF